MEKRDNFSSRFAILVAMAGSAVGLGNLWRFPYLVGEYGGAAFILVYIACLVFLSLPIFLAEFIIGRRTHSNAYSAFRDLAPGTKWKWAGALTVFIPLIIASYYCVVGGWGVQYFLKSLTFSFTSVEGKAALDTMFTSYITSTWTPLIGHFIFLLVTAVIVVRGVKGGIEKFSKVMMPILFLVVVLIAVRSMTLEGASVGINYLFNPDFSKINAGVITAAMGQAFYSLSLGCGTIMTYASYVSKKESILTSAGGTAVSDFLFAMIAGCAIMPAVFAAGLNPGTGPGLVFETLPYIFSQMPLGGLIAILFFLALLIAAVTSSISMYQVLVAYMEEVFGLSIKKATIGLFFIIWILGILCSLSFGPLADFKILGLTFFDLFDKLSANFLMPLGGLLAAVFVGWRLKKTDVYAELTNNGEKSGAVKLFGVCYFLIRYIAPITIIAIFISNLV
jgi:NSS family neurotransmitter:Na+ symporter